jgi:hypothetical protein
MKPILIEQLDEAGISLEIKRERLKALIQANKFRGKYEQVLFGISVIWLGIMLTIVVKQGNGTIHLADSVLITFISTTTVNVLAFFVLVVKYFFSSDKSD